MILTFDWNGAEPQIHSKSLQKEKSSELRMMVISYIEIVSMATGSELPAIRIVQWRYVQCSLYANAYTNMPFKG